MPRAALNETLKSSGTVDQFESLKLTTGEYARLLIVDDEGYWEWVHSMRAPVLDDAEMPVIIDKQRKDGSTYPDYSTRFVGQRICLGDPGIVEDKGMDPDRCPACAAAQRGVKGMTPERRFALSVIRYKTRDNTKRSGGGPVDVVDPPQAEILVWKLSQRMFNMLMDCKNEIRELLEIPADQPFSLRAADVVVYCEDGGFQRVVFKAPKRPAYRQDAALAALVKALWGNEDNRPTDAQLKAACGRVGDREYMLVDVEATEHGWRQAERYGKDGTRRPDTGDAPVSGGGSDKPLDQQLDDLLGDDDLSKHPGGLEEFAPRDGKAAAPAEADIFGESDPAVGATRQPAAAPADDPLADDAPAGREPVTAGASNGKAKVQSFGDILAD